VADLELRPTNIRGCFTIQPVKRNDERGYFVKTFVRDLLEKAGLETNFPEEYHSSSHQCVIRGLHFQRPPYQHAKLVYCVAGAVLDAVLDLRVGSPSYAQHQTFNLNADNATMLYVPAGLAHGFEALEQHTVILYKVSSVYAPTHDDGVRWDSTGIRWNTTSPIVSSRDRGFARLEDFESPFIFGEL
jgi:dTDP-4-dehydrorhamnose 3,5-epimerase